MADDVEFIEINLGDGEDGKPRSMKLPKEFSDASGNKYNGQDVINSLNGKIKSVAMSEAEKKYAPKLQELKSLQEATKGMIPADKAAELQREIEEMQINLLPEKEREIARQTLRIQALEKDIGSHKQVAETKTQQYHEFLKSTELMANLPSGDNGVIDQARAREVELIKKYAKVKEENGKDIVIMDNIFESGGEPIDMKTFMTKYYAQPDMSYALKSSLVSGGGTQQPRNLGGKTVVPSAEWNRRLASANATDRATMTGQLARGEVVVQD